MTNTQTFIEDAIKGGLNGYQCSQAIWRGIKSSPLEEMSYAVFLDPLAWQAVGKTRGWNFTVPDPFTEVEWLENWHLFIDHLADGLSIEESLAKLT